MPPPPPKRTHYEVLGVPPSASLEEIKKRYREMARQYHPDVNQSNPAAGKIFGQITTAYKILSDADDRKTYDAELSLMEQQKQRMVAAARQRAANGGPTRNTTTLGGPARPTPSQNAASEAARLTAEAQAAFARSKFAEARSLAEQALRLNRRSPEAYEVLGDVFRLQGKTEEAMNAYSMCLQINPRNTSVMQRLERMARATPSASGAAGPSAQRVFFDNQGQSNYTAGTPSAGTPGRFSGPNTSGRVSRIVDPNKQSLGVMLAAIAGYGIVFLSILYVALYPGDVPRGTPFFQPVSSWNATILVIMAICGSVLGATMTITNTIRRIDDELVLSGVSAKGGTYVPLGLLLVVMSLIFFYGAALIYAIISFMQESLTPTMLRVFGAVVTVVILLAVVYSEGHWQVMWFGGNVVFLTFVIGWLLGDFFRPDGY